MAEDYTQKLLEEKKKQEKQGSLKPFNSTVIDTGVPVREHFPNLRGADGKVLKDERGYNKKGDKSDGFMYTLAVFGQPQFVRVVLSKKIELTPAKPYKVSGFGYDMGPNFYIEQEARLTSY